MTRTLIADVARRPQPRPARDVAALAGLTEREREIVALVAAGLSNDEIAARLVLSPLTAKTHVSRAMTKLGVRDRAQLVVLAWRVRPSPPRPHRLTARDGTPRPGSRAGRRSRSPQSGFARRKPL